MNTTSAKHSFAWLNATQFFGALNDNAFKLLIIFFLVDRLGLDRESTIVLAGIVFVVPFLLFSQAAGVLADRFSKQRIVIYAKIAEFLLMSLGLGAILLGRPVLFYMLLFLMCTQSAFFGPSKYGIIPELVRRDELSRANSFLIGLTYLAIIIGTFLPSLCLKEIFPDSFAGLALVCIGIALAGLVCSLRIGKTPAAGTSSTSHFSPLFFVEIFRTLLSLRGDRFLFLTLPSVAYFLFLGAFLQQDLLLLGPQLMGWDATTSGYLFPMAAVGIAAGAFVSGRLSGRSIEFGIVPVGAIGLTLCCLLLGKVPPSVPLIVTIVFFTGFSAGLFIVPLQAFIQQRSPHGRLGEILACMNFLSFLGVALSSLLLLLLTKGFGLSAQGCFIFIGVLTGALAVLACAILPDFLIRFSVLVLARVVYRIRTVGAINVPIEGPALLVANHVTWSDALILSATQQRRIRFIMDRAIYRSRWLNPLFRLMKVIPIAANDPPHELEASIRQARESLDEGALVCIFPEQWLTRNGNLLRFKHGVEHILKGTDHPIVPIYIGGGWGSVLSHYYGRLMSRMPRRRCRITVVFGEPLPADTTTYFVRQAVSALGKEYFDTKKNRDRLLPIQLIKSARRNFRREAVSDTSGKQLSFGKTLVASVLLGDVIRHRCRDEDKIGILLPACVGGVLCNTATTLIGKIPVNLNFTASSDAFTSAIEQCRLKTIITARPFAEKLSGKCPVPESAVYIEDLLEGVTSGAKMKALLKALFLPARRLCPARRLSPDDTAAILFSSGSTGEPKGIMLTHHNLLSNLESFNMVIRFSREDRLCAVLPLFHSFGFTATLWTPLLRGFSARYHPNPIEGAVVAEMVREHRLTLLFGTPTFLLTYMPKAKATDFASLRMIVTGAEKLKKKLADRFEERYGVRPYEGYGATELAPVTAVGLPDVDMDGIRQIGSKEGSVGHPIPGVTAKVVHPESGEDLDANEEGLLLVKGANVMKGYLGQPEQTQEVTRNGWYVTGDIARIDSDGFIFLLDRLMRYSKIGGEMVPHLAVEEVLMKGLDAVGQVVFVTAAPDERKGEQLVVLYTEEAGDADRLHEIIRQSPLPNLWHPRKNNYFLIDEMPALGSGKLDLKKLKMIAKERTETTSGGILHARK